MNFFCAITQNLNTCKNHSTASKYSCNTTINATQFICAHKTWSDGGERIAITQTAENHATLTQIAITQTAENHATLTQFITQSQTFLFFIPFILIFCTMTIPQTDSKFSKFHLFLNEAHPSWENAKFGLGDHDLVFECDIF